MTLKGMKKAPVSPKAEAGAKALKGERKQGWKVSTATENKDLQVTHLPNFKGSPNSSGRAPPEKQAWPLATTKFPLTTESAVEKTEYNNTRVLIVDMNATKHQLKQAMKKLYGDIVVAKINTLIRPEGEKKAYVQLASTTMLWMLPTKLNPSG